MTDELYRKFAKRYPLEEHHSMSIYEANERIYLCLMPKRQTKRRFTDFAQFGGLAKKIFHDVDFFYGDFGLFKNTLKFTPNYERAKTKKEFERLGRYNEHMIEIGTNNAFPSLTVHTGNRGHSILIPEQRDRYFRFVNGIYRAYFGEKNRA